MINQSIINAAYLLRALKEKPGTKLKAFSQEMELSLQYMEQIGRKLLKADIISSKRGPGGGYSLKKEKISILDLVLIFTDEKKVLAKNDYSIAIVKALHSIPVI